MVISREKFLPFVEAYDALKKALEDLTVKRDYAFKEVKSANRHCEEIKEREASPLARLLSPRITLEEPSCSATEHKEKTVNLPREEVLTLDNLPDGMNRQPTKKELKMLCSKSEMDKYFEMKQIALKRYREVKKIDVQEIGKDEMDKYIDFPKQEKPFRKQLLDYGLRGIQKSRQGTRTSHKFSITKQKSQESEELTSPGFVSNSLAKEIRANEFTRMNCYEYPNNDIQALVSSRNILEQKLKRLSSKNTNQMIERETISTGICVEVELKKFNSPCNITGIDFNQKSQTHSVDIECPIPSDKHITQPSDNECLESVRISDARVQTDYRVYSPRISSSRQEYFDNKKRLSFDTKFLGFKRPKQSAKAQTAYKSSSPNQTPLTKFIVNKSISINGKEMLEIESPSQDFKRPMTSYISGRTAHFREKLSASSRDPRPSGSASMDPIAQGISLDFGLSMLIKASQRQTRYSDHKTLASDDRIKNQILPEDIAAVCFTTKAGSLKKRFMQKISRRKPLG